MKTVCIESPLAGDFVRNIRYARFCLLDCLRRGEAPFVSHLLYTQVWDDTNAPQRSLGILAGLALGDQCDMRVVYGDLGRSKGMNYGIAAAGPIHQPVAFRKLPGELLAWFQSGEPFTGTHGATG